MIGTRVAAVLFVLGSAGVYCAPAYKANLDYARTVSMLAVLPDLKAARIDKIMVARGETRDISTITGQAKASRTDTASSLLTEEDTRYSFKLVTKSYCFELQPGCLEIQQKNILKAVSVKVFM